MSSWPERAFIPVDTRAAPPTEPKPKSIAMLGQHKELKASLRRVTDCLATFIRETEDPGTEALAALYEAQRLLSRT